MELQARNLIIDTQYFVQNVFDFNRKELVKLRDLIEKGSANLYLTDITIAEVRKQIKEKLSSAFDKFDNGDTRYLKPLSAFKKILDKSDKETFVEEALVNFDKFLNKWQVKLIESREVNFLHIHEMYSNMRPPFSVAKKKEFPDAFALEAIRKWRDHNRECAYLISKDDDWQKYIKAHKYGPFEDFPSLFYLEDISTFIDSIIRKDEELKDQVKLADKILSLNWIFIKENILKEFKQLSFESDGIEDEEVLNVFPIECTLTESDIIGAFDNAATYELTLDIEVIVKLSVPNYENAFYDKKEGKYYNLNYVEAYVQVNLETYCIIDFSFEDGLERNFHIINLEFDNKNVRISFGENDYIDIEEWTKSLKVYLCGVKDGEITEDGLGVMEFDNFSLAKEVFPELDIYSPSKKFTNALGNKITDILRFETWKVNDLFSS